MGLNDQGDAACSPVYDSHDFLDSAVLADTAERRLLHISFYAGRIVETFIAPDGLENARTGVIELPVLQCR